MLRKHVQIDLTRPTSAAGHSLSPTSASSATLPAPIIYQPQVAILGTRAIKKRPVVVETPEGDVIASKPMMLISLSYDHRLIDGALAGRFMARLEQIFENYEG
ncbi:MAG: 2-oxo acid dehydrogenase subunit E2 [Calditrichaeota bacterium]|nr:2-oxo acid dehydrogenase subunit E2 [Calditrichota bacterium]